MQLDRTTRKGAAQNISRKSANAPHPGKLPVEAIRKVFPPAAAGEFVQNFCCGGKLLTLLLPRQAAAVLPRKLLNYSSAEALTGSGREKREKEISEFIDWFACRLLHNAFKMFLVSPRSRKSKSCPVESLELAAEEKYWSLEVQGDLATPPQRNTREILSSPLLQFGFSLPAGAGWLILRVDNAVHRF